LRFFLAYLPNGVLQKGCHVSCLQLSCNGKFKPDQRVPVATAFWTVQVSTLLFWRCFKDVSPILSSGPD
jgi:hypothetical protein